MPAGMGGAARVVVPAAAPRRTLTAEAGPTPAPAPVPSRDGVTRVIEAMHAQIDQPMPLHDMAKIASMSLFHFSRTFRKRTGVPPCQFLYALRLEEARRLLLTTGRGVLEICYDVGYNSLGTFTRRFTELFGLSPTRLRGLARRPASSLIARLEADAIEPDELPAPKLSGTVTAPDDFDGLFFIGLFASALPQGHPVRCRVLDAAGDFRLTNVPPGVYTLFAAGVPWSEDPKQYLHYEWALRAGGQTIHVSDDDPPQRVNLRLRAPLPSDPPILMTFPVMAPPHARGLDAAALRAAACQAPLDQPSIAPLP